MFHKYVQLAHKAAFAQRKVWETQTLTESSPNQPPRFVVGLHFKGNNVTRRYLGSNKPKSVVNALDMEIEEEAPGMVVVEDKCGTYRWLLMKTFGVQLVFVHTRGKKHFLAHSTLATSLEIMFLDRWNLQRECEAFVYKDSFLLSPLCAFGANDQCIIFDCHNNLCRESTSSESGG